MIASTFISRTMPRRGNLAIWAFATIAIAIPAVCWAYVFAPIPASAPVVILPSQLHKFAAVLANSKSTCTFNCRNNLWDVLFIDRIDRSCGCTTARADRTVVLPGQAFVITATLSAPAYTEDLSSHITVRGHAGRRRVEGTYELSGSVEDALEFPDAGGGSLRLGSWQLNELPATATIRVNRGAYPLDFDELRAECSLPGVSTRIEPISNEAWRLSLRLNSTDTLGATGFPIAFRFAQKGRLLPATVVQEAYVEVLGPITASPTSLLFTLAPGEHIRQAVTISNRQPSTRQLLPQIVAVSPSAKNVAATWQNTAAQSTVIIDYTAPTGAGADRGEIVIFVNDHGTPQKLKVGYLALIS